MADRTEEIIKKFLDEVASSIYQLETKHGILPENVHIDIKVRRDVFVTNDEAFKNVRKN